MRESATGILWRVRQIQTVPVDRARLLSNDLIREMFAWMDEAFPLKSVVDRLIGDVRRVPPTHTQKPGPPDQRETVSNSVSWNPPDAL